MALIQVQRFLLCLASWHFMPSAANVPVVDLFPSMEQPATMQAATVPKDIPRAVVPEPLPPAVPGSAVTTSVPSEMALHRAVLGMAAPQPALQPPVQAGVQQAMPVMVTARNPLVPSQTIAQLRQTAALAANAAGNAANAAVTAAQDATNAATSANTGVQTEAAKAASAAKADTSAAQAATAAGNAANAAAAAAQVAATAAASAHEAATVAARADPVASEFSSPSWSARVWALFAGLTFATIVKTLCIVGNVLVQVSPLPSVKRWEARGCTGDADAAPYVAIAFGGCQWCFYGMFAYLVTSQSGFLVLVHSNFLGAVLGAYYVTAFYHNCRRQEALRTLQKYGSAVTSLALLQVCALSALPAERALFLIGIISSFCSFINATSVLSTLPVVIRTKNSRSIPGPYAVANAVSSAVWVLCGFLIADPCVMMPNIFSVLCAITSLVLKYAYPAVDDEKAFFMEEGMPASSRKAFEELIPLKPTNYKLHAGTFSDPQYKIHVGTFETSKDDQIHAGTPPVDAARAGGKPGLAAAIMGEWLCGGEGQGSDGTGGTF